MFDRCTHRFSTWCLALLALALTSTSVASGAPRWQPQPGEEEAAQSLPSPKTAALLETAARTDDGRVQVLVELRQPAGAEAFAQAMKAAPAGDKRRVTSAASTASRNAVAAARAEQNAFAPELARLGARELYRVSRVLNGIAVAVEPGRVKELLRLPGVKRVLPIEAEYPTNSTSVPFLGTPEVWGNTTTPPLPFAAQGTGIRIGVIDTGTDYMHSDFAGPDLDGGGPGGLGDYTAESTATTNFTTLGSFPTAKVVGGTDFAGDNYTGSNLPVPDPNPMDCNGHGSHVSGTAAGLGVNADGSTYTGPWDNTANYAAMRIGPGTAPQALVYGLRVFGCFGSTGLTTFAIDWAMDPDGDDDVSDHLDVINMSLGSNFGSVLSATAASSDAAALAGVIVVTSAGNAGDTFFISGSPGSATHAIATAASVDDGVSAVSVQVNSPPSVAGNYLGGAASYGPAPSGQTADGLIGTDATTGVHPLYGLSCGTSSTDGCCPFTNAAAMVGKICVVDRGTCTFKTKTANCQAAGGIGLVVVDNAPGSPPPGLGDDALIATVITIPTERVTLLDGTAIKNAMTTTPPVNMTLLGTSGADTLASFSSRGPRRIFGSPLRLKPDIAAPGQSITSVQTGHTCLTATSGGASCTGAAHPSGFQAGNQTLVISGTSMASPHMAGIMALLRQLHPDWSVDELKALALNYAVHDMTLFPGATPPRFGPSRIGGGRTDPVESALGEVIAADADVAGVVSVVFDPEVIVSGSGTQTKKVRVTNKGTSAQTYDLAFDNVVDSPGVVYSLPGGSSVTVNPGEAEEIDVLMTATPLAMEHSRDASLFPTQGVQANYGDQPRNFLTEEGSYLTFSQSSVLKLRVPVYMAQRPASTMSAPATITTGLAPTGSTTIPLTGADICTGTLAAGPTCTGTFPTDVESLVTPLELQVASGLDPVNSTDYADIQYAGVGYDATNGILLFGVSTWGDWSTLNDVAFNFCVDLTQDGVYDRSVYNSNPAIFVAGASFNDNFVRIIRDLAGTGNSILGVASPVNAVGPNVIDTALHLNNVMFLAVTPAQLGLTGGDTNFTWKLVTCPATNPNCARTTGANNHCAPSSAVRFDEANGPFFYNYAAQGLDFGGDWLDEDLNGNSIPVTWNTANMTTNGSLGALLLHHHNGRGNRAEVVLLEGTQTADLSITKGVTGTQSVGSNVTFTLTVTNNGPDAASGVVVSDFLPAELNYVSDDGAGAYDPNTGQWTVGALAVSGSAILNITATIVAAGPSCNTATITEGTPLDTEPDNNQATACVDAQNPTISKTDGITTAIPGQQVTYTIVAYNNTLANITNIMVKDTFPASLTGCTWTCVATPGADCDNSAGGTGDSGVGNINEHDVDLAIDASVTYTATCTIDPAATGSVTNTATFHKPPGGPIGATDVDTLTPQADLSITKDDNVTSVAAGTQTTYTITVSNAGPSAAPGTSVTDNFPAECTSVSYTSVAAGGATGNTAGPASGNISDTLTLPVGSSVTYTATCDVGLAATGTLSNTATVTAGGGVTDPTSGNNSATDNDTITAASNLSITKDDGVTSVDAGDSTTYTITVTNPGPSAATGVSVGDSFPAECTSVSYTSVAAGGATGNTAGPASGNISDTLNMPATSSVTYTAACTIDSGATGTLDNTATITFANDPDTSNNSATDSDTLTASADLTITKDDGVTDATPGGTVTYTIIVSNVGPSDSGGTVVDNFPAECTSVNYTSVAAGGATGNTAGPASGNISDSLVLPAGSSVTYTAVCSVDGNATVSLANTATITPGAVTDPDPSDNSATDEDQVGNSLFSNGFEEGDTSAWDSTEP